MSKVYVDPVTYIKTDYTLKLNGEYRPGEKCEHNRGQWVVKDHAGTYHVFNPPTQLQKDIWVDHCNRQGYKTAHLLRWFCYHCGNIQEP